MRQLDREGNFKAMPTQWGIKRNQNSQSVALVIEYKILAQLNAHDAWEDWSGYEDHCIIGWHYIVKRDGAVNLTTVDSLVAAIGWDGNIGAVLNDPPFVTCQITVASEEYNGKSRLKVQWINPEDYTPNSAVGGSDADVSQINAQFGSLLRAAAASARSKLPAHEMKATLPAAPSLTQQQAPQQSQQQSQQQVAPAIPIDQYPPAGPDVGDGPDNLPF